MYGLRCLEQNKEHSNFGQGSAFNAKGVHPNPALAPLGAAQQWNWSFLFLGFPYIDRNRINGATKDIELIFLTF